MGDGSWTDLPSDLTCLDGTGPYTDRTSLHSSPRTLARSLPDVGSRVVRGTSRASDHGHQPHLLHEGRDVPGLVLGEVPDTDGVRSRATTGHVTSPTPPSPGRSLPPDGVDAVHGSTLRGAPGTGRGFSGISGRGRGDWTPEDYAY